MVVGLGTGSTATRFIQLLGDRVKRGLKIRAIPSSNTSKELAESLSIPIIDFHQCPGIDVAIDGADEIAPGLALIKGASSLVKHEVMPGNSKGTELENFRRLCMHWALRTALEAARLARVVYLCHARSTWRWQSRPSRKKRLP